MFSLSSLYLEYFFSVYTTIGYVSIDRKQNARSKRNTFAQLMVVLMFVCPFGFLLSYDGFILKSEAVSCCCSGGQQITFFAADSSGSYRNAEPTRSCSGGGNAASTFSGYCGGSDDCEVSSGCNNCEAVTCSEDSCCKDSLCSGAAGCGGDCHTVCDDNVGAIQCDCIRIVETICQIVVNSVHVLILTVNHNMYYKLLFNP